MNSTNANFPDSLVDVRLPHESGYPRGLACHDDSEAFAAVGAREFPSELWIEPRDWKQWAEKNDELKTWPDNYRSRRTNQNPTHECTCHALIQNIEIAYNRQRMGAGMPVWLSPLSVYAEANPRQWGGSYLTKVLSIALERGVLPAYSGAAGHDAQKSLFKHTLNQSSGSASNPLMDSGPWVPVSRFPAGWETTAKHFKPHEVINPRSAEQMVCLVLRGFCVCVGRDGHAIPHVRIVWRGDSLYAAYSDSYEVERYDSWRTLNYSVGSSYSVISTVVPDDWSKPAGKDQI